jgi:hypothetical protein
MLPISLTLVTPSDKVLHQRELLRASEVAPDFLAVADWGADIESWIMRYFDKNAVWLTDLIDDCFPLLMSGLNLWNPTISTPFNFPPSGEVFLCRIRDGREISFSERIEIYNFKNHKN